MRFLLILVLFINTAVFAKTTTVNITRSLYYDAKKQGLSANTISTIMRAFSWEIDFNKDMRKGDKFIVIGSGNKKPEILIFKSRKKHIKLFLWGNSYYDKNGESLGLLFLKHPLKYDKISSKFQLKRYHPILKTYMPHRAVDYAAKRGTAVKSVADGIVTKRRNIGVLGNAVFIKHGNYYETVYAHLFRFAKIRVGSKVKKGQIIGYVGSTGRSTGPHLHYELRYKGKRKNPLTYKFPKRKKLNGRNLEKFKKKYAKYL